MTQINQLTAVSEVKAGDQFPLWSTDNGGPRKAAASVVLAYIQDSLTFPAGLTTQYAAPSATAFSVAVAAANTWLILTPGGAYADGEIVLPATVTHGQEVLVNCTQAVTTFVVDGNGNTVTGAPAALAANGFFRLRFDAIASVWYRVG